MINKIEKLIIEKSQGNEKEFALKVGIKPQTLNNYTTGKRSVSLDAIMSILSAYPDVSAEWLLRDKGEMILSDNLPPILGDESENDLDTHAKLTNAINDINDLNKALARAMKELIKKDGVIEWQKEFISELIDEKNELEKKLPQEKKKDIV